MIYLAVLYVLYVHLFTVADITLCWFLLTYLLTPWCRVHLEKLTGLQLVKKFPAFHGTPRFITALTSVRHLSLSWASPIQSIYAHPTSWRSILILSTHLRLGLPTGLFPSVWPTKTLVLILHLRYHAVLLLEWNIPMTVMICDLYTLDWSQYVVATSVIDSALEISYVVW